MKRFSRSVAVAFMGTAMLVGGNCVPDNFWINTWGAALGTVADTAVDLYVVDPIVTALTPEEDADGE